MAHKGGKIYVGSPAFHPIRLSPPTFLWPKNLWLEPHGPWGCAQIDHHVILRLLTILPIPSAVTDAPFPVNTNRCLMLTAYSTLEALIVISLQPRPWYQRPANYPVIIASTLVALALCEFRSFVKDGQEVLYRRKLEMRESSLFDWLPIEKELEKVKLSAVKLQLSK